MNKGFEEEEIKKLKAECEEEGQSYIFVEDEDDLDDSGEFVHFQFVGKKDGKEVIYDTLLYTLHMHYNSILYEEAEKKVLKIHKDYVPFEERTENYKVNEDAEELLEEFMEEMEEEETVKVAEFLETDEDFDFGIGLEVALNIEEITPEVIATFIDEFNSGKFKLDKTMYSFKNDLEDED
ncbi:hypothetical protein GVN16_00850 [Emticicia sp. CRIBPO]|uniref:hypothetical protein n=1 Tax=Emticicia sp. CRIBPO TaxID=2683258 RepID=UPI0014129791|nr:hypothetical protein [Emticicia sp. CRIBPO]NBA84286.1 hypothetical protein [Emticicia sp. CRIBPO]